MIKVTIEIEELDKNSRQAVNVALRVNRDKETAIERGLEQRILPAVKHLLRDSGLLGERAN